MGRLARSCRMARKTTTIVADKPPPGVTLELSRVEAQALLKAAETGLRVVEALDLVRNTGTMSEAVSKLRSAAY